MATDKKELDALLANELRCVVIMPESILDGTKLDKEGKPARAISFEDAEFEICYTKRK